MLPEPTVKRILAAALKNGGDLAELYLEDRRSLQLTLDDGRLPGGGAIGSPTFRVDGVMIGGSG